MILAIIALIATPIVLNIISESRGTVGLRNAEIYVSALETTITSYGLENKKISNGTYEIDSGNICLEYDNNKCINTLKVKVTGKVPKRGSFKLNDGKITEIKLIYENKTIIKDDNGQLIYIEPICTEVEKVTTGTKASTRIDYITEKYKPGDEYKCKVTQDKEYIFFVLSTNEDGTINLIMDRNIYYDKETGESSLVDEEHLGNVYWYENVHNSHGPVTVMDYLYNATKGWDNIPNIVLNYKDSRDEVEWGYTGIETRDSITQIIKKDGTISPVLENKIGYENLKARLPYEKEISNFDRENMTNLWMYNYLETAGYIKGPGEQHISGISCYWLLNSFHESSNSAWVVRNIGKKGALHTKSSYGVRPVITVPPSYIN